MNRFFSSSPIYPNAILAIVRIVSGLLMVYHGWEVFDDEKMKVYFDWEAFNKFNNPILMIFLGKIAELVAGILLTLGFLTRIGSLILICLMTYITFFVGEGRFWYQEQHPFLLILLGIIFLFYGGGKYSLDHLIFKKRPGHI